MVTRTRAFAPAGWRTSPRPRGYVACQHNRLAHSLTRRRSTGEGGDRSGRTWNYDRRAKARRLRLIQQGA